MFNNSPTFKYYRKIWETLIAAFGTSIPSKLYNFFVAIIIVTIIILYLYTVFRVVATSILLYGCTTWTLTKRLETRRDWNYTRMLRVVLNKSWKQNSTKQELYGYLPPISQTIHVEYFCWSKYKLINNVLLRISTHKHIRSSRKNIYLSTLYGHCMSSRWLTKSDDQ